MRPIPWRTLGVVALGAGALVVVLSLFADDLGLGSQPGATGWKQWAGLGLGALSAVGGAAMILRPRRRRGSQPQVPDAVPAPPRSASEAPIYDSAAPRVPFLYELRELYRYRFLLWNLISRDLKVRYKRSALGFVWAMVNPLLTMAVMVVVFSNLFRGRVENYPIFLLSGLLLWRLFAGGTSLALRSVVDNSYLTKKIYVPSSVFVAASMGGALIHFLFAAAPLLLLAVLMGARPQLSWAFLIVPVLQTLMFAFGIGLMAAALAVSFADLVDIYEVLVNAYYYLTPIIYPLAILPEPMARLEQLNPMHHFIAGFRDALLSGQVPDPLVTVAATLSALLLTAVGWSVFTRLSDRFAYQT